VARQIELSDLTQEEVAKLLAANSEHLAGLAASFTNYNDSMALELERCRRMVSGTGTALADLAESIADKVEEQSVIPRQL
jgi:hypothetical protein